MPGTPQKQKWAAATITKQTQKLAKKIKPVTTKYFPFPLIPTKARTTKLAETGKTSKINQNHVQPVGC